MTARSSYLKAKATLVVAVLLLLLAVGCGSGADEEEESLASPVPSPVPTAVVHTDIREVEFSQVPQAQDLLASGGEIVPETIIYADLTADGQEEAVVPIASGGTAGDIGFAVFTVRNGTLEEILVRTPGRVVVEVEEGGLVETQPIYGPDDPNCCPSQLKKTYYRWDGDALVVEREETIETPQKR